ncbi:nucleoside diphosphate kinase regulator [Edwardsiella anguillarum]|nr:nucleoside diphosphate kinase regulator [Edwardsiella anguillarum]BET82992.1 nucleoside diphosphate kinase regulator [Edwardsiella anguillarum]BET86360.1 nucleoside diphosphate kinase regulator [Edwardsiella anguillarum]BET89785.1 nucleoside diphosphate kinase regulator [Edwardsiella anguillarum]
MRHTMERTMSRPAIIINELDAERLDRLLERPAFAAQPVAQALNEELDRAQLLAPAAMPADVVTMNSRVRFRDLNTGEEHVRTLVYPHLQDSAGDGLSVMAPIGAALLGLRVGDAIRWTLPNGNQTHIEVLALLYQPEAAGELLR